MANPARAYLATQVKTTSQGELLLLLYEAAIKFLKRAKIEIDKKDYAKKGIYISKTLAIIHELTESLNKDKGGEITPKLAQLYAFCTKQLVQANIRLDNKMIDDVINILDGIRSAYAQIVPEQEGKSGATVSSIGQPADKPADTTETKPQQAPQSQLVPPAPVAPPTQRHTAQPGTPTQPDVAKQNPASPPPVPPKIRSGQSAAKFRAANAYTNNT